MRPLLWMMAACARGPAATPEPEFVTLHFAAINDFHGALYETVDRDDPSQAIGGLPWLVSAMNALRTDDPDLVVLDGGDLFQGVSAVNHSFGRGSVQAFNLVGVDAAAVGNHEFDYGPGAGEGLRGALLDGASQAEFAWLAANITNEDGSPWAPTGIQPWILMERKGIKIGVVGLSTMDTPQTTKADNVADLRFTDPVAAVESTVSQLREQGARVIVAVGHLTGSCEPPEYGLPELDCIPDGEIGRLLTELPPGTLDLLVMGHAHTMLANRIDDTFVIENRAKGHMIGQVELVVGPDGVVSDQSRILPHWLLTHDAVDPGCEDRAFPTEVRDVGGRMLEPDASALQLIETLEASAPNLCEVVSCASRHLGRNRQAESAVGDVVADAMLHATGDAHIAITNSGGLRADLREGEIRLVDVQAVMPFDNALVTVDLAGSQLVDLVAVGTNGDHGIIQVSGARITVGENGVAVLVNGTPVEPDSTYRVVTTDFLLGGGDGLGPTLQAGTQVQRTGPLLRDAISDYLRSLEGCVGDNPPIPDSDNPRIVRDPG